MTLSFTHHFTTDLAVPIERHSLEGFLVSGDRQALTLSVTVRREDEPVCPTSAAAYVLRADGTDVWCECSIDGDTIACALPLEAAAVPGPVTVLVRAGLEDSLTTVLVCDLQALRGPDGETVLPAEQVPSLEELLARLDALDDLEEAADHARTVSAQVDGKAAAVVLTTEIGESCACVPEKDTPLLPIAEIALTQDGEGTPSVSNIRPLRAVERLTVTVGGTAYEAALPSPCWGGTVSWPDGTVTHRWARAVLDGTEEAVQSGNGYVYLSKGLTDAKSGGKGYCSHYSYKLWSGIGITGGRVVYLPSGMTADAWKAYLAEQYAAGTPVTMVYELASPVTEAADLPALYAAAGEQTLTHDGNGTLAVTYHADLATLFSAIWARLDALEA